MSREIKFRGYSEDYKTMFNYDYLKSASDGMVKICQQFLNASDIDSIPIAKGLFVPTEDKDMTLMQYTGLRDNTKWEQLTDKEKTEFYKLHCSEDGRTIKYQHIEDVKHLWEGKEIYEGDIIEGGYLNPLTSEFLSKKYVVEYERASFVGKLINHSPFGDTWLYFIKGEVIGNIYENPELLKV